MWGLCRFGAGHTPDGDDYASGCPKFPVMARQGSYFQKHNALSLAYQHSELNS